MGKIQKKSMDKWKSNKNPKKIRGRETHKLQRGRDSRVAESETLEGGVIWLSTARRDSGGGQWHGCKEGSMPFTFLARKRESRDRNNQLGLKSENADMICMGKNKERKLGPKK